MKELTSNDIAKVEGGFLQIVGAFMGAYFMAGYMMGKDLAERDNAL